LRDAAARDSRCNTRSVARDRRGLTAPLRGRVRAPAFPRGGSFTPALRALDSPIAIACLADRAPCFPSRTWWISSLTNSPACVDGDLP
jgi:hypothetical protein